MSPLASVGASAHGIVYHHVGMRIEGTWGIKTYFGLLRGIVGAGDGSLNLCHVCHGSRTLAHH